MTFPKRFLDKVHVPESGCWEWCGSRRRDGYGRYRFAGSTVLAHRASWMYCHEAFPDPNLKICHRCDNPRCVNPDHLFLGTQADNVADMIAKGRLIRKGQGGSANSQAKLTEEQVGMIRTGRFKGRDLAKQFGVSQSTISMVKRGHNWSANRRAEMKL